MTASKAWRIALCVLSTAFFCVDVSAATAQKRVSRTKFYRALIWKEQATVEDMVRLAATFKGYDQEPNTDSEIAFLATQGVNIDRRYATPDLITRRLTKGGASAVMMKALGIKGGVMLRIFPHSRRYALREASNLRFLHPKSNPEEPLSGKELSGLFVKMIKYVEAKKTATDEAAIKKKKKMKK